MKKYLLLFAVIFVYTLSTFSQVNLSPEKLLGDWKVTGGSGEHFDEETIGSVFHFQKSGKIIADLTSVDNKEARQQVGVWKVSGNSIIITGIENGKEEPESVTLNVTKFEDNLLFILDEKAKMLITFERIKN